MRSHILLATVTLTACAPADTEQQSASTPAQGVAQEPAPVTLEQFRQMQWIVGSWRGSGGAYPSFFEEYRAVDDSTIQMRALSDSTFSAATDSSWIEFRNGAIRKRGIDRNYVVVALSADSVRFARPGEASGGHTFSKVSADEWTATLHPSGAGGQPTVYVMRRVQR